MVTAAVGERAVSKQQCRVSTRALETDRLPTLLHEPLHTAALLHDNPNEKIKAVSS